MRSAKTKMGDTKISRVIVRSNEAVSNDGRTCSQPVGWGRSIRSYHENELSARMEQRVSVTLIAMTQNARWSIDLQVISVRSLLFRLLLFHFLKLP